MTLQTLTIANHTIKLQPDPAVWSPYSATEMLTVLLAQGKLNDLHNAHVLDFGTGSGIVGILCGLVGAASVTVSDYCEKAVAIAAQNAQLNGLSNFTAIHSDRFAHIERQDYDLIISNPPVQPWLYTDVADQEHRQRVEAWNEAGADGRLVLDSLLCEARNHLKVGGRLITSSSSRHGHAKTQHLLDTHWPEQWRQIYAHEHSILPDYHGPYMKSWQAMQAQDLDLRVYQQDGRDRPYAYQTLGGQVQIISTVQGQPARWQRMEEQWVAVDQRGDLATRRPLDDPDIAKLLPDNDWLYQYYLLEAVKT